MGLEIDVLTGCCATEVQPPSHNARTGQFEVMKDVQRNGLGTQANIIEALLWTVGTRMEQVDVITCLGPSVRPFSSETTP